MITIRSLGYASLASALWPWPQVAADKYRSALHRPRCRRSRHSP